MAAPARTQRPIAPGQNGAYTSPYSGIDVPELDDADLMQTDSWDAPNITAAVYRRAPIPPGMPSNKALYCGKHPTPCDIETIREAYGGGLYSVLFNDERGRRVGQKTLAVEGPPRVVGIDTKAQQQFQPQPQYPMVYAPPQPQTDPTLIAILDRMDRLTQTLLSRQDQPSTLDRLAEMKQMSEVMKSFSGPPAGVDPGEFAKWMRTGFNLRAELEGGGGAGPEETPQWLTVLTALGPKILEFLDRRAVAAARGVTSSAPRRVGGPPPLPKPGMSSSPGATAAEVPSSNPDEAAAGLPKWILATAREFIREIKQESLDPEYMAAWISRNVPARVLERWGQMTPSVVKSEFMQLSPLVAKGGVVLSEDFVNGVVRCLVMDEPENATVIDVAPVAVTEMPSYTQTATAVEEEDDDDDDTFSDDEDEDDLDDEESDDDDDDEESDDDDEDLELKSTEESGLKG